METISCVVSFFPACVGLPPWPLRRSPDPGDSERFTHCVFQVQRVRIRFCIPGPFNFQPVCPVFLQICFGDPKLGIGIFNIFNYINSIFMVEGYHCVGFRFQYHLFNQVSFLKDVDCLEHVCSPRCRVHRFKLYERVSQF